MRTRLREHFANLRTHAGDDSGSAMLIIVLGMSFFIIMWSVAMYEVNSRFDARRGMDNAAILTARAAATQTDTDVNGVSSINLTKALDEATSVYNNVRPFITDGVNYSIMQRGHSPTVSVTCIAQYEPPLTGCYKIRVDINDQMGPAFFDSYLFGQIQMDASADAAVVTY